MPVCAKEDGSGAGCGEQFDHWAGREDAAGLVALPHGSVWKRLQHDRPVSITPEEDSELLEVFNAWEQQQKKKEKGGGGAGRDAAMAREIEREEMTWEDLSDA
eukprot:COSAG06_NODE_13866_length_1211_cov_1.357914_2_plen_103_part_00